MKTVAALRGFDSLKFVPVSPHPRERLSERTHELARIAGRTALEITQRDYERAKREVTGETDPGRQAAMLDALPPMLRTQPKPSGGVVPNPPTGG